MFDEMQASAFPEFLAAFWAEKGWETSVTENDDGTYLVAGDKDSGTRGLMGVRPDDGTEVDASEVEDFLAFCDKQGVDVRVMATLGRFTTGARTAADSEDIHLLDPNELANSVREEGVEEMVTEYTGGGGGGGGRLPSLPVSVPTVVPVIPILVAALVVAAAVFVGPTLLGSVPFVDELRAGSASGQPITALSLSDADAPTATVRWTAQPRDEIRNYTAPAGQTFVVVAFEATATGSEPVTIRDETVALAANGTFRSPQSFTNASTAFRAAQLPKQVPANGTARGIVVFQAPADFDGATLVERYGGPGLRFQRADDLSTDVASFRSS
ncbi:restriction endonuclease [Halobacterium salinarum]|nr:restriction endonuclease [Halobacterium salinarum]